MKAFEAAFDWNRRQPVENRPKCFLLIPGEGIKVENLKENDEQASFFLPAGFPFQRLVVLK
jgi:hypothetical protein